MTPIVLDHGERYGKLTVIKKLPSGKYKCGCICGFSGVKASAKALMRGLVKSCKRCGCAKEAVLQHNMGDTK